MPGRIVNPRAYAAAVKRNNAYSGMGAYKKKTTVKRAVRKTTARKPRTNFAKAKAVYSKPRSDWSARGIGSALGSAAGSLFKHLTGFGSYKVKKNTLLDEGQGPPIIANSSGNVRIRHREFIQDVNTSVPFTLQYSEGINPGNRYMFPWLSSIADSFQQYRMHGLIFEFKTTSSDALNSTNTALGSLIMMTDYNVYATPPTNKQIMENQEFTVSTKPSESTIHAVECAPSQTSIGLQYIRTNSVPSGQDARLYDLGQFNLATVGSQASPLVGELWASYDCELLKPQLTFPQGQNVLSAHYANTAQTTATTSTGPFLGMLPKFDSIGLTFDTVGGQLIFPSDAQGNYSIQWNYISNNSGAWLPPTVSAGTGASLLPMFNGGGFSQSAPQSGTLGVTSGSISTAASITFEPVLSVVQFSSAGQLPTSAGRADLYVTQVNLSETT